MLCAAQGRRAVVGSCAYALCRGSPARPAGALRLPGGRTDVFKVENAPPQVNAKFCEHLNGAGRGSLRNVKNRKGGRNYPRPPMRLASARPARPGAVCRHASRCATRPTCARRRHAWPRGRPATGRHLKLARECAHAGRKKLDLSPINTTNEQPHRMRPARFQPAETPVSKRRPAAHFAPARGPCNDSAEAFRLPVALRKPHRRFSGHRLHLHRRHPRHGKRPPVVRPRAFELLRRLLLPVPPPGLAAQSPSRFPGVAEKAHGPAQAGAAAALRGRRLSGAESVICCERRARDQTVALPGWSRRAARA